MHDPTTPDDGPRHPVTATPEKETPPPSRRAKILAAAAALVVLATLGGMLAVRVGEATAEQAEAAAARAAAPADTRPEVAVGRPEPATHATVVAITGTLEPVRAADLAFEAGGRIRTIDVALGATVHEGDVLATLDRAAVGAAGAQTAAAISMAEAQLAMARDRLTRVETLSRGGAASDADRTGAAQAVALAEAQLASASAARRATATASAGHVLRAPFDGVVTRVPDAPGAVVAPGIPVFRIEDLTAFDLRASVSEADVGRVATGQPVEIAGASTRGSVRTIVRSLDPATRRAPVEIAVPNDGGLVGHALVRASIVVGEPIAALRVPASAVRADDTVLVVGASDVIEVRPVVAHVDPDGTAAVTSGLDAASRVVLRPSPRLHAGDSVRIAPAPAPAAAP